MSQTRVLRTTLLGGQPYPTRPRKPSHAYPDMADSSGRTFRQCPGPRTRGRRTPAPGCRTSSSELLRRNRNSACTPTSPTTRTTVRVRCNWSPAKINGYDVIPYGVCPWSLGFDSDPKSSSFKKKYYVLLQTSTRVNVTHTVMHTLLKILYGGSRALIGRNQKRIFFYFENSGTFPGIRVPGQRA